MTIRKRWTDGDAPVSSLPPPWEDRKTHTPPSTPPTQNTADLGKMIICAILGRECNMCAAFAIRRVCSAPRRRGFAVAHNTLRPGGARRDPRCESVGGARVLSQRARRFGPEPWSDSLTANPGQSLTVPDSLKPLTALSLTA